jgi:hypothetical protein
LASAAYSGGFRGLQWLLTTPASVNPNLLSRFSPAQIGLGWSPIHCALIRMIHMLDVMMMGEVRDAQFGT